MRYFLIKRDVSAIITVLVALTQKAMGMLIEPNGGINNEL